MHVALAMPNWITGIVGLVKTDDLSKCREACELIYYYCYITDYDFIKIPPAKRGCTLRIFRTCIEKGLFTTKLVYADPYRAVNELCTKHRINRLQVIDAAFTAILKYLIKMGEINCEDNVIVDEELGNYIDYLRKVHDRVSVDNDSPIVKLAKLVASIPDVATSVSASPRKRCFKISDEFIEIDIVDIHDLVMRDVEDRIRSILMSN